MNFIGHDSWSNRFPILEQEKNKKENDKCVKILRNCMFFHENQVTTLSRIEAHFTEFAIKKLFNDKFIEFL